MAKVTLGQDLSLDLLQALEVVRRTGQEQLVPMGVWSSALSNTRLNEVSLDPLREPLEVTVTIEGI